MYDTSYTLTATARKTEVPADKLEAVSDLVEIKAYYKDRYGQVVEPTQSSEGVSLATGDFTEDLFK